MKKQTVFIKRYIDKGQLPKDGWVLTPSGAWMFHGGKFRCPHDGTIQQGINEWLEEIELHSEEEIKNEGNRCWRSSELFPFNQGAKFILNKLKGETKQSEI